MSRPRYVQFPISILMAMDLSPIERIVWVYLRHRQGQNSAAWPSLDTIASELGLHKDTVREAIRQLVAKRYLERKQPKTGRGHTPRYKVLDKGRDLQSFKGEKNSTTWPKKGMKISSKRVGKSIPELEPRTRTSNTRPSSQDESRFGTHPASDSTIEAFEAQGVFTE